MALGADDAQAAGVEDVLLLLGAGRAGALERLGIGGLHALDERGVVLLAQDLGEALGRDLGEVVRLQDLLDDLVLELEVAAADLLAGELLRVAAQEDIRAAAGHVRRDRDGALAARLRDDLRLALVELGVQHVVLDAALGEDAGELLGVLDGDGAHKDRLALLVAGGHVVGDGGELRLDGAVHEVVVVDSLDGLVGRDDLHGDVVDLAELRVLGHGRARHAGELVVHEEVVLERDRGEGLVLLADDDAFLGLDGLVQALGVAPALHDAARELVDDLHLAVHDHVLLVAVEHVLGLERLLQVVHELARDVGVDVVDAQGALDLLEALVGRHDGVLGLVHLVVDVGREAADGAGEVLVGARGLGAGARDDERGARLVDEDGVGLVDDGEVVAALDAHLRARDHVVAQVVEAELGVRAVGDVGLVGGLLHGELHAVLDEAHVHAQEAVDAAHPLGVALGEVVVHGDDVDALAGDGVQVAGERGDERLALARLHLGDGAAVQRDAADDLHVEVAQAGHAARRLADAGERLGEEVVQGLAGGVALAEQLGLRLELIVGHGLETRLEVVHLSGDLLIFLQLLVGADGEQLGEEVCHVGTSNDLSELTADYPTFSLYS